MSTFIGSRHVEISNPILQSATSSRVSPALKENVVYSSTSDIIRDVLKQEKLSSQEQLQVTGLNRLQTKYASPDNLLDQNMSAHLNIASIEADAVGRRLVSNGTTFSDTSSDISDFTTSNISASNVMKSPPSTSSAVPVVDNLSDQDVNQVDLFYRSHKTDVRVCKSLANLYVSVAKVKDRSSTTFPEPGKAEAKIKSKRSSKHEHKPSEKLDSPDPSEFSKDEWAFAKTGIPVLVLDTGDHIRERKLSIVLAERGTGFTLWSDVFNHLTKYSTPHANFHTVSLSTDSSRLIGLSFDEGKAAAEFADDVTSLTENPDDELLNLSKKNKKNKKEKNPKYKPPKKVDISQPCCFLHVTKLERPDFLGIPLLAFPPPPKGTELVQSTKEDMRRALSESSGISDISTSPSELGFKPEAPEGTLVPLGY